METKTSVVYGQRIGAWFLTILPVGLFVAAYAWVAVFSVDHSKMGNLMLGVLTWTGALISLFLFVRISNTHKVTTWSALKAVPFWTFLILIAIGVWHLVGGLFIPSPSVQQWFAFGPSVVLLGILFLMFMKFFMEFPKSH